MNYPKLLMDYPKLLTVQETAGYLRVNEDTVRTMVKVGKLPGFMVGQRCIRIRESDVIDLLNSTGVTK